MKYSIIEPGDNHGSLGSNTIVNGPGGKTAPDDIFIQMGANNNQYMYINRCDCRTASIGVHKVVCDPLEKAEKSLGDIDRALDTVNSYRARAGAQQNRLEYAKDSLGVTSENLSAADSRLRDTDMAKEMMEYTKTNILTQAGLSMLSQANQSLNTVISLLK